LFVLILGRCNEQSRSLGMQHHDEKNQIILYNLVDNVISAKTT
jgi:hypothetical protein